MLPRVKSFLPGGCSVGGAGYAFRLTASHSAVSDTLLLTDNYYLTLERTVSL